jgi:TfoX N-terminal domain
MAYDEVLAGRVRSAMAGRDGLSEQKMFGGLCFMLHGNMFAGVESGRLPIRGGASQARRGADGLHGPADDRVRLRRQFGCQKRCQPPQLAARSYRLRRNPAAEGRRETCKDEAKVAAGQGGCQGRGALCPGFAEAAPAEGRRAELRRFTLPWERFALRADQVSIGGRWPRWEL